MKVAIIDYGLGNLGSVSRGISELRADPFIAERPEMLDAADRVILPGVGSFGEGMANLQRQGWDDAIHRYVDAGRPLLGICLGMQLLSGAGTEGGEQPGLNLIPGTVRRLDTFGCNQRIPHVGWNSLRVKEQNFLLTGVGSGTDFYFVHSFAFAAVEATDVVAVVDYEVPLTAVVARGLVFGTQFHPEKSSKAGFRILRNFLELTTC